MKINLKNGVVKIVVEKDGISLTCAENKVDRSEQENMNACVFGGEKVVLSSLDARTIADELYSKVQELEKRSQKRKMSSR